MAADETSPMVQRAPFPDALQYLVDRLTYRPGWAFKLAHIDRGQGSEGLTLIITTRGLDSYHPERGENYRVNHYMTVPPASFNRRSWQNWLFEQLLLVERHECMEFFAIRDEDGTGRTVRPFAPAHGPGNDPYLVLMYGLDEDRRTSFLGDLNPE